MTSRYESSPANLRALRDRLTQAAKREGVVFGRLQQHVGVLVVTQFTASLTDEHGEPLLLVKAVRRWNFGAVSLNRAHRRTSTPSSAVTSRPSMTG